MKKLSLFTFALLTLSACGTTGTTTPQSGESDGSMGVSTIMPVPAEFGSDVEEMIVTEDIENEEVNESEDNRPTRIVEVSAVRFEFTPSVILAKQGEKVLIKIDNTDTVHNIFIPELDQFENSREFLLDTSKKGEFEFNCANFCGEGHLTMTGKIIIE